MVRQADDARSKDLRGRLQEILSRVRGLPSKDLEYIAELVEVGEWVVALQDLCTQLYEHDLSIPEVLFDSIVSLGNAIGVEERYWSVLRVGSSEAG